MKSRCYFKCFFIIQPYLNNASQLEQDNHFKSHNFHRICCLNLVMFHCWDRYIAIAFIGDVEKFKETQSKVIFNIPTFDKLPLELIVVT